MLSYEYKLDGTPAQEVAIEEAIRAVQFVRNKALRLWMDTRGTGNIDLQCLCAQLAKEYPFAGRLNSQARQASASRAWFAISRFYENCKRHTPGKKGYPKFQHDNRSVEYKQTGWRLEPDGRHITFTDGCGIGTLRLVGNKRQRIAEFPAGQIKRVRLVRRADGYYCQFGVEAERQVVHEPSGEPVGIDLGLRSYYTTSSGETRENPATTGRRKRSSSGCTVASLASRSSRTIERKPENDWRKGISRCSGSARISPASRRTRSSHLTI